MDVFTLTGTLLDPEGLPHVGVQIHAVMTPTVKVDRDDDKVYSRPVTAVTDSLGQFSAALLTLPDLWYQLSCSLPVFTPNPLRFEAPADGVTLDIADIVDETPTPTYNAVTVLIGDGGAGAVTSVAGRTGVVVLTKSDVGLSNVDDTTDAGKPISTATATALAAKATPADITAAVATEATDRADADTTLQTNIDGKAATSHTHTASQVSDSTTVGRAVLTAVDAAAARAATGAGTSDLALGTSGWTAKAGDYQPTAANISDSTATGRSVLTAVDAAAARTAIGAGTSSLTVGTTTGTVAAGDDSRITGAVQATRQVIAGTGLTGGGTLAADRTLTVAYGSTSTTAAVGNDSRLSDSRTPTAHASTHAAAGSDPLTLTAAQLSDFTEATQDVIGALVAGGSGITATYDDSGNTETLSVGPVTANAQTGTSYTLVLTDAPKFVTMSNASASTLTVPPNSSVAFPVGTVIEGAQLGAGQVTLTPGSGVTINATPGLKVAAQYGSFGLIKTATDTWLAVGRLSA